MEQKWVEIFAGEESGTDVWVNGKYYSQVCSRDVEAHLKNLTSCTQKIRLKQENKPKAMIDSKAMKDCPEGMVRKYRLAQKYHEMCR